ncbi:hypothetical protein WICMUC_001594 [Wickerhamomyces mucosus]|uniref:Uncharacterized protein n=1 Tax=Wickerhamomyces mucosus TaxID=1378264 RepID=A0A9P8PTV2_9ASCO|nr:hypothetical protein WICMUC_001594 [Wickerhamomyces mucosus]
MMNPENCKKLNVSQPKLIETIQTNVVLQLSRVLLAVALESEVNEIPKELNNPIEKIIAIEDSKSLDDEKSSSKELIISKGPPVL